MPPTHPGSIRFSGPTLARISGGFWFAAGMLLVARGLILAIRFESTGVFLAGAGVAAVVGTLKGQTLLRAMARRNVDRLRSLPQPAALHRLFPATTWVLIAFFMTLGIALQFSPLPVAVRSTALLAVGLALGIGGVHSIRNCQEAAPVSGGGRPSTAGPEDTRRGSELSRL